ncbi:ATP-binding protein [Actinophytocola sp.]|uniref:ATP-binding protein n=1 Tax=Actinophytocola sp. TaxID=1872138 RepID=UPI002ED6B749
MSRAGTRHSAGNLPAEVSSFVGRRQEVVAARRLLRRHRLVTLTGGPGVGKTRLALQVAAQLANTFPGGVWLVELAALEDDKFLAQTVADALGVRDHSGRPPMTVLTEFLKDRELLMVLDNCEHLVDAVAVLVTDALRAAPRLRILATSREALRSGGEHLLEVPPLPVPDAEVPPTSPTLVRNEAVRLFAERAALARPGFTVNARNRRTVARVCRRLEGIPLAIELAAVRVRALSLEQLLTRLESYYFELLAEGSRTAVPRMQPLRAAIDWSFDLCSEEERRLWARAAVFSGSFDLDAAEHVCSGGGIDREDMLELMTGLVEKSVLVRSDDGHESRYRMLDAIRNYGHQQLGEASAEEAVRTRHRDHYAQLTRRVQQEVLGPNELLWLTRLRHDHDNLRNALEFCLTEPDQARTAMEIAASPWYFWLIAGHHGEGRHWLDTALSLDQQPSSARAKALWVNGWFALLQADWATGRSMVEECRALAVQLDDEAALAHATRISGLAAFFHDEIPLSVTLFEQALTGLHAAGDRGGAWMTHLHLIAATAILGDRDRVRDYGEQCLNLVAPQGAPTTRSWSLWVHGFGRWLTGDRQEADGLIREALRAGLSSIDRWGVAHCLEMQAWVAAGLHDGQRAARLLGAAHTVWRTTGTPPTELRHLAPEHNLCEQQARESLGDPAFITRFDEGTHLTTDQAITYAIEHASAR